MTGLGAWVTADPDSDVDVARPVRAEVRLRMRPNTAARGRVDGAWWPRSHDPATEFPGLVLVISSWIGPVRRVTYHLDDWDMAEDELDVEGWPVTLDGLPTLAANTITVLGSNQRRVSLLVVPPDTPGAAARAVLLAAARPDTVASAAEILAMTTVGPVGRTG